MLLTMLCSLTGAWAHEITVYDGTETDERIPVFGYYANEFLKSEYVIPATELTAMKNGAITKMTWYLDWQAKDKLTGTFQVFLKEVSETTVSSFAGTEGATIVFEGNLGCDSPTLEVNFSTPYNYKGGNLLVGVYQTVKGNYNTTQFYGKSVTGAGIQGHSSSSLADITGYERDFIPKTTFQYDFTTDCDAVSIPFTEGFEGDIDCWSLVDCADDTGVVSAAARQAGEKGFRFSYNFNPPQYLISPELAGTENGVTVSFYYKNPSNYTETFMVGYSTTTKEPSDFTWDSEITAPTEWTQYENVFPAGTKYVAVKYTANNQFRLYLDDFSFTLPPSCVKPRGLTVSHIGVNTAVVSWTSSEPSFDIDVNGHVTENVTSPYTLTGLTMATGYTVKVRAKNSKGYSEWTDPVSFFTEACPEDDKCFITLALTDSYGDGWGDNAIKVVDHETGAVLGTFANTVDADPDEAQIFTLAVCPGREIDFVWVMGSYFGECSWVIKDVNDEEICSGQGNDSMDDGDVLGTFLVDCTVTPWRTPTGLTASEIGPKSVKLSWKENSNPAATAWVVAYKSAADADFKEVNVTTNPYTLTGLTSETAYTVKVRPATTEVEKWSKTVAFTTFSFADAKPYDLAVTPFVTTADVSWNGFAENYDIRYAVNPGNTGNWLQYDNGEYVSEIGFSSPDYITWGAMYPGSQVTGDMLTKVSVFESSAYNTEDITINIYQGGTDAPGTLLYTETVTPEAADAFHEITLAMSVDITPGENLWITLTEYGTYVMAYCQPSSVDPNNQWVESDGSWYNIGDLSSSLSDDCWMIRGYLEDSSLLDALSWTTLTSSENTCQLTGLTSETEYLVQVRSDFGSDGKSQWATGQFTTKSPSAIPVELAVSDLTATSAKLSWTGYQDSYNVQYRTAKVKEECYFYNFNDGKEAALAEGWKWDGNLITGIADPIYGYSSSENMFLQMGWDKTDEATIVSPELPAYGNSARLQFCYFGYSNANTFQVGYSSTTDDLEAFTWSSPIDAPLLEYTLFDDELPAGTKYVAFKATASSQEACVFIDDFKIVKILAPAGAWTTATVTEPTLALTGLTRNTEYEWQVQGNLTSGTTAWSEMASFTTSFIKGDANNDGQVTITDAVAIVNYILGNPSLSFSIEAADVNKDGSVTITDAVGVVNIILNNGGD